MTTLHHHAHRFPVVAVLFALPRNRVICWGILNGKYSHSCTDILYDLRKRYLRKSVVWESRFCVTLKINVFVVESDCVKDSRGDSVCIDKEQCRSLCV